MAVAVAERVAPPVRARASALAAGAWAAASTAGASDGGTDDGAGPPTVLVGCSGLGTVATGPVVVVDGTEAVVAVVDGVDVVVAGVVVVVGGSVVEVVDVVDVVVVVVVDVGFPTAPALPMVPNVDTGIAGAAIRIRPNTINPSGPIKVAADRPLVDCDIAFSFVTKLVGSERRRVARLAAVRPVGG